MWLRKREVCVLIECPECHGMVSDAARSCPHCGYLSPEQRFHRPFPPVEAPRTRIGPPTSYTPKSFVALYLWWAGLAGIAIVLGLIVPAAMSAFAEPDVSSADLVPGQFVSMLIGLGFAIGAIVVLSVLLYRAWAQIQDGHARTTPGHAVGFRFIPLFNYYWSFVALRGFAVDANAYCRRYGIPGASVSGELMVIYCVLIVCSWIPLLGILTAFISTFLMFIVYNQIANASAAIAEAKLGAGGAAPPTMPA